jgi:hypothetical protein
MSERLPYSKHVESVYAEMSAQFKDVLKNGVNSAIVLELTAYAMKCVAQIKDITGYEKKVIVLTVIGKMVEDSVKSMNLTVTNASNEVLKELSDLKVFLENGLGHYIDQLHALGPKLYGKTKGACSRLKCKK